MLRYTRIGVNLLTGLVVAAILIVIFLVFQMTKKEDSINPYDKYENYVYTPYNYDDYYAEYYNYYSDYISNIVEAMYGVSKIVIPKIGLVLDVESNAKVDNENNNLWLEVNDKNLERLNEKDIIIYLSKNGNFLYRVKSVELVDSNELSNKYGDLLTIIKKNNDKTVIIVQAEKVGGLNEK